MTISSDKFSNAGKVGITTVYLLNAAVASAVLLPGCVQTLPQLVQQQGAVQPAAHRVETPKILPPKAGGSAVPTVALISESQKSSTAGAVTQVPMTYQAVLKIISDTGGDVKKVSPKLVGNMVKLNLIAPGPQSLMVNVNDQVFFSCEKRDPAFKSGLLTAKITKYEDSMNGDPYITLDRCTNLIKIPVVATTKEKEITCTPSVLHPGDTLSIKTIGQYKDMLVGFPKNDVGFFDFSDASGKNEEINQRKFAQKRSMEINVDSANVLQKIKIFSKSGNYTFRVSENLETDDGTPVYKCSVRYIGK